MKRGLERIEATLSQLNSPRGAASSAPPVPPPRSTPPPAPQAAAARGETCSFKVGNSAQSTNRPRVTEATDTVQPFPVQEDWPKSPNLPKFKLPSFSNHRHAANPNLAIGLLREIEEVVVRWQTELQQVMLQIQALYLEGPIVDGWLESHRHTSSPAQSAATGTLRHAEIAHLMEYVQDLCSQPQGETPAPTEEASRAGYRLCGLDTDGQLWCRPCPTEQLPYVSLAIARYQKLRQLLARRQLLETKLSQLAKTLVGIHSLVQDV
ncbi:hypothetical protein IQ268_07075 [Oculatella sp. LEGE 06141]|uniref:hypothetical protein n=1 Tax=Oculatella sp. LEGE 06141 TaxID=1828648 RepID=UPI001880676C|nr:hypothetical protein [Oculatella sp. LEGE 06141]MBE9178349.1 hypothetical protein [Oculatella sp. LEGE 06141]